VPIVAISPAAAVAGDDHVVGANQHRIDETELGDRGGDLRNLSFRMRPRVANIGNQPLDRPRLDIEVHPMMRHVLRNSGGLLRDGPTVFSGNVRAMARRTALQAVG